MRIFCLLMTACLTSGFANSAMAGLGGGHYPADRGKPAVRQGPAARPARAAGAPNTVTLIRPQQSSHDDPANRRRRAARPPNTVTLIQPQQSWHDRHPSEAFDSRRAAVQRKAEFLAAQRMTRIAVTKAMGISRQRPNVYHTLFGSYLPRTYPYNGGYLWRTSVAWPPAGSARYR